MCSDSVIHDITSFDNEHFMITEIFKHLNILSIFK